MSVVLYCDSSECVNCARGECQLKSLTLFSGACEEYEDVTKGPDYQEEYFIACRYRAKNETPDFRYRTRRKGKRVELNGTVFYTKKDIREGIEGAMFTEAVTGFAVSGKDILNPERFAKVRKLMRTELPVEKLPWMDEHGGEMPTPHEEG